MSSKTIACTYELRSPMVDPRSPTVRCRRQVESGEASKGPSRAASLMPPEVRTAGAFGWSLDGCFLTRFVCFWPSFKTLTHLFGGLSFSGLTKIPFGVVFWLILKFCGLDIQYLLILAPLIQNRTSRASGQLILCFGLPNLGDGFWLVLGFGTEWDWSAWISTYMLIPRALVVTQRPCLQNGAGFKGKDGTLLGRRTFWRKNYHDLERRGF